MCDYSFTELADMHYCYGFADGESHEAAKIYAEKYPDRDHPAHTVFQKIDLQLRQGGCLTDEDIENLSLEMADSEVKRKGRPKKRDSEVVATPTKKSVSNGDDAAPPAKRGRGRPPKGGAKKAPIVVATGTGRGRGRPPKVAAKSPQKTPQKKKKESEDEEDEAEEDDDDDEDDKKSTSSADDAEDVESS